MPEYLAPAVYVEEIERGPKPIEGVATSLPAFLGATERGPTKPRFVSSYGEFQRYFGGPWALDQYLPQTVSSFFENGGTRCFIARIVGQTAEPSTFDFAGFRAIAVGPGTWGDRVFVQVGPSTTTAVPTGGGGPKPIGYRIRIAYWQLPADASDPVADPFGPTGTLGLLYDPAVIEDFDDVVFDNASHPNYFSKQVNGSSALIRLELITPGSPPPAPNLGDAPTSGTLADGDNGAAIVAGDYDRAQANPEDRIGLQALLLDPYRDVSLVYAPHAAGADAVAVAKKVIDHCERQRYRFAVIDAPENSSDPSALDPRTTIQDSKYAAFYYPWLTVSNPSTGALENIPPGGAALGIYARTDRERGVWKAPANEVVRGAMDVEYEIDHDTQGLLNPRGVNVTRKFAGRGIRLWGARTLSSDPLNKYVSVRRTLIFLEASIDRNTQWVVFEPNDQRLWARVTDTLRMFLRSQWREGALMGAREKDAFLINCGLGTTMTQAEILNGQLIVEVGVAIVRPAEFVIFRIFQLTAEAQS